MFEEVVCEQLWWYSEAACQTLPLKLSSGAQQRPGRGVSRWPVALVVAHISSVVSFKVFLSGRVAHLLLLGGGGADDSSASR